MYVAGFRDKINLQDVGSLIGRVYESIHKFSLQPLDSHMMIFHSDEMDTQTNSLDIEVCVQVNKHLKTEQFQTKIIEGMTCAKTTHTEGFSKVGLAHAAVIDWIGAIENIVSWGVKHIVFIAFHGDPTHLIAIEEACVKINKRHGVCAFSPMGAIFSAKELGIGINEPEEITEMNTT